MEAAALQAASFADREQPLDGAVAVVGLGAVARFAPQNAVAERSLSGVVGGRDAGDAGECPERVVALKQSGAEPGGLRVAAAGALLKQSLELLTAGARGQPARAARSSRSRSGVVEDREHVGEAPLELAARAGRARRRARPARRSRAGRARGTVGVWQRRCTGRRSSGQTRSRRRDRRPAGRGSRHGHGGRRSETARRQRPRRPTATADRPPAATRSHPRNAPQRGRDARGSARRDPPAPRRPA